MKRFVFEIFEVEKVPQVKLQPIWEIKSSGASSSGKIHVLMDLS